jgi:LacI family transcriptional regulator
VVVASHSRDMGDALELDWDNFSAVKIDYFPHHPVMHNVTNNQSSIVRLAMRKVLAGGYQRVGFVMHRGWDHAVDHHWTAGFLCEQQHLPAKNRVPAHIFPDLEPVERWFHETHASVLADYEPFRAWMKEYKPDVIISKGDYVLPLLERMGLKIPRDIGFVDLFLEDTNGKTAGVRQNHALVGATAVEILAGQLQHNKFGLPEVSTTTFVQGTWFDGASCPIPRTVIAEVSVSEPARSKGDNVRSRKPKAKR